MACGKNFVLGLAGIIGTDLNRSYYAEGYSVDNRS